MLINCSSRAYFVNGGGGGLKRAVACFCVCIVNFVFGLVSYRTQNTGCELQTLVTVRYCKYLAGSTGVAGREWLMMSPWLAESEGRPNEYSLKKMIFCA